MKNLEKKKMVAPEPTEIKFSPRKETIKEFKEKIEKYQE